VALLAESAEVMFDPCVTSESEIAQSIISAGYECRHLRTEESGAGQVTLTFEPGKHHLQKATFENQKTLDTGPTKNTFKKTVDRDSKKVCRRRLLTSLSLRACDDRSSR
jgi:hypothetical protein